MRLAEGAPVDCQRCAHSRADAPKCTAQLFQAAKPSSALLLLARRRASLRALEAACNRQRAEDTGQQNMQHATVRRRRALPLPTCAMSDAKHAKDNVHHAPCSSDGPTLRIRACPARSTRARRFGRSSSRTTLRGRTSRAARGCRSCARSIGSTARWSIPLATSRKLARDGRRTACNG